MTNTLTNCPECGVSYAMVGRVHRCVPKTAASCLGVSSSGERGPDLEAGLARGSTYRHRDPDKWRAYMKDYMRGYRARRKANAGHQDDHA